MSKEDSEEVRRAELKRNIMAARQSALLKRISTIAMYAGKAQTPESNIQE